MTGILLSWSHALAAGESKPPTFPAVAELKVQPGMPDLFARLDGTRLTSKAEWPAHRAYLKAMLAYYQYGHMPARPKDYKLQLLASTPMFDQTAVKVQYALTLTRKDQAHTFHFVFIRPDKKRRFPTIIKNCYVYFDSKGLKRGASTAKTDLAAAKMAISRGYLLCKFNRREVAADTQDNRSSGLFPLYPEYDWGTIAAWAWAHGVVLDALDRLELADMKRVVATGHSRGGKTALCAGIYDERIAITAPNSSGTGGTGSLRYFGKGKRQNIAYHVKKFKHWWHPRFLTFAGKEALLPFDAHTAKALIAPRPFINANARQDHWANPLGTELTYRAAEKVYDWLDATGKQGLHWRNGLHAQSAEDWAALLDFADLHFFGKKSERSFSILNFPEAKLPFQWEAPEGQ